MHYHNFQLFIKCFKGLWDVEMKTNFKKDLENHCNCGNITTEEKEKLFAALDQV